MSKKVKLQMSHKVVPPARKQKVIKKCCEDGKIFPQHNIHAENLTRISLKLIISFVIEVLTDYFKDGLFISNLKNLRQY